MWLQSTNTYLVTLDCSTTMWFLKKFEHWCVNYLIGWWFRCYRCVKAVQEFAKTEIKMTVIAIRILSTNTHFATFHCWKTMMWVLFAFVLKWMLWMCEDCSWVCWSQLKLKLKWMWPAIRFQSTKTHIVSLDSSKTVYPITEHKCTNTLMCQSHAGVLKWLFQISESCLRVC